MGNIFENLKHWLLTTEVGYKFKYILLSTLFTSSVILICICLFVPLHDPFVVNKGDATTLIELFGIVRNGNGYYATLEVDITIFILLTSGIVLAFILRLLLFNIHKIIHNDFYVTLLWILYVILYILIIVTMIMHLFGRFGIWYGRNKWHVNNIYGILMFVSGLLNTVAYPITMFVLYLLARFLLIFNIGINREPPITYKQKLVEPVIQILLLPVSAIINAISFAWLIGGAFTAGVLNRNIFYFSFKNETNKEDYSYNVGESDYVVSSTVTHNIKDNSGNIIGTYDTTEYETKHDSGYRFVDSEQHVFARWTSMIALPCRIISLVLSIFALIIPKLYISVRAPKKYDYNDFYMTIYRLFDIIAFKNN